jgi:ketosteroid isomerase-like protein
MTQDNVELVRRLTEAINARVVPEELLDSAIQLENVTTAVTNEVYTGFAGARKWMDDLYDALDDQATYETLEIIAEGDDFVVAIVRFAGRGRVSGAPLELRYVSVTWIRDGKIVRGAGYESRREALEAVGLRE